MKQKILLLISSILLFASHVYAIQAHHDLRIILEPEKNLLHGKDSLTLRPAPKAGLVLFLNREATDVQIQMDGQSVPFTLKSNQIRPHLPDGVIAESLQLFISYSVRFDDPVPILPANADNPGFGVSGTIDPKGTFLLDGAQWYPRIEADQTTFHLRIEAPAGMIAVTAGRNLGHKTDGDKTVSTWKVDYPIRGLSLSAAHYQVTEKSVGRLTAATYFFSESSHLSGRYLEATERYLRLYEELFGPYPFEKFAIVENFFPTGYGFPSYTLLGSRVLRLPFIVHTSLGHEIAHCWWGNGVYVNYKEGNWSEGLTTYVADYLYKEMRSTEAAREYREQILRNYATLVNSENDFPIRQFQSRSSPLTKTIGYDKCAMVFHMLRIKLGEDVFWASLRDIYKDFLFTPISWTQIREGFERRSGIDLSVFFKQWIDRDGAPRFAIGDIATVRKKGKWRTTGMVIQDSPFFYSELEVALLAGTEKIRRNVSLTTAEGESAFYIESSQVPTSLVVDPEVNFFRQLDPSEIPPSINNLKGADSILVVLSSGMGRDVTPIVNTLVQSLGLKNYEIVMDKKVTSSTLNSNDLILVGYSPMVENFLNSDVRNRNFTFSEKNFVLLAQNYSDSADTFFGVFEHPFAEGRTVALYLPLTMKNANAVARKVTHYGKYSYLVFSENRNRVKGIWPINNSPLVYHFHKGK